jgi:NADPH-dependent 2,4-dienoyl-CoA reductase/sulfur reductase-like enzyme
MRAVRVAEGNSEYGRRERIVIVGGGPAGWAAATELRKLGFSGEVVVIAEEKLGPYDRPACSKGLLSGHQLPRDIRLRPLGDDVTWRIGARAEGLDTVNRRVLLDTGEAYAYDALVIATGSRPTLPRWWPSEEMPNLFPLHAVGDAVGLRHAFENARKLAIVGGGLTGSEVACAAVSMARKAVIINSQPFLMPRNVGEPIGALITESHRAAGIDMRLGQRVKDLEHVGAGWRLTLDSGEGVTADVVVLTTGERPDTDWLEGSGLDISDGVLCDPMLRAVGADGVVAAGALVRWPNLRYGWQPQRVGQWIAALEHGQGAARTLMAGVDAAPVSVLPRYWSDQLGLRIQVCGRIDGPAEVGLTEMRPGRKATARAGVLANYSIDGRLAGVVAVNAPKGFTVASRMLAAEPVPSYFDAASAQPAPQAAPVAAPVAQEAPLAAAAGMAGGGPAPAPGWYGEPPAPPQRPERRLHAVH